MNHGAGKAPYRSDEMNHIVALMTATVMDWRILARHRAPDLNLWHKCSTDTVTSPFPSKWEETDWYGDSDTGIQFLIRPERAKDGL